MICYNIPSFLENLSGTEAKKELGRKARNRRSNLLRDLSAQTEAFLGERYVEENERSESHDGSRVLEEEAEDVAGEHGKSRRFLGRSSCLRHILAHGHPTTSGDGSGVLGCGICDQRL